MTAASERGVRAPSLDSYRSERDSVTHPVPADYRIPWAACDRWAADPGRRALLDLNSSQPRWWTFSEVADASRRLANGLRVLGVGPGDRVGILLPQGVQAAVTHLAVYRLGAIALPLSTMHGPAAIGDRVGDSETRVVVSDVERWERLKGENGSAVRWVVSDPQGLATNGGWTSFEDLVTHSSADLVEHPSGAETPCVIVYTSGTTGPPKGVVHAQRVVAAHAPAIHMAHDGFPQAGDLLWSPADWAWAGGLVDCLLSAWHAGIPIVAWRARRFDPHHVVEMLETHQVRNTFLPATALRLLMHADIDLRSRVSLRSLMTGGEPVGAGLVEWSRQELGLVPNEVYGQTEASMIVGNSQKFLPVRPGSSGVAYPGATIGVLQADGDVAPTGNGEVVVRADSPAVMLGYWRNQEATDRKIVDGWLRTGDVGRIDEDGYLWFLARGDDVILSSGYRIGPAEIEECLAGHPSVLEAAVVGLPDAQRGQVVHATVVPKDGVGSEALTAELQARVRSRLAAYEVPRSIDYVVELPRTTTGKVQRSAVRNALTTREGLS